MLSSSRPSGELSVHEDTRAIKRLTVDTTVLPELSVVVMTVPPATVLLPPEDMLGKPELPAPPIEPDGLAEPLEFVLPPIIPPVAADAPVVVV